jgi:hypothetical protein
MSQANPNKKFLSIQFFASHGYCIDGTQWIGTNNPDPETGYYELINPEEVIREQAARMPNVYFLLFFAACREGRKSGREAS